MMKHQGRPQTNSVVLDQILGKKLVESITIQNQALEYGRQMFLVRFL